MYYYHQGQQTTLNINNLACTITSYFIQSLSSYVFICTIGLKTSISYKLVFLPLVKSSGTFSCTIICCKDDMQPINTSLHCP